MSDSEGDLIGINYLHALWRAPALVIWMLFMPLVFFVLRALKIKSHKIMPHVFHRGVCLILGLRVKSRGEQHPSNPTLFVSNHISYLDVFVLGNIRAYFVAKSEVANWPILGPYARFQNTLFIERKAGKAKQSMLVMKEHLQQNKSLILFPEGTSTDGRHVEPFRSSLFAAAESSQEPIPIQPITLAYTHQGGKKMNQSMRDHYAWYATMPFLGHFLKLMILKKVDVKVYFHPVCYLDSFATRKECADHCHKVVAQRLDKFNE